MTADSELQQPSNIGPTAQHQGVRHTANGLSKSKNRNEKPDEQSVTDLRFLLCNLQNYQIIEKSQKNDETDHQGK